MADLWRRVRLEARAFGRRLARLIGRAWSARWIALHALAIVAGWALLTAGIARLLVSEVWLLSGGLFLLSVAGWGHLRTLFSMGLYALSKRESD